MVQAKYLYKLARKIKVISGMTLKVFDFIRRQKRPFKVNLLKNVFQNFSLALTQQYQSIFISDLGANPIELGYVNSIGGIAGSLVSIPMGWLATKLGIRKIFLIGMPLLILSSAVFALAKSWEITIIALIIFMLAQRITQTGCPLVCGNTLKNEERATGMQLCDTLSAIPRLIAPIAAAYIISTSGGMQVEGIRPLYWIKCLGLIISLFLIYKFFTNPVDKRKEVTQPTLLGDLGRIFKEGMMVKRWIIFLMLSSFPMYIGNIFTPLYAAEVKGANESILGWMFTASYLVIIPLAFPMGRLADTFGRKKLILLMTPLYCISLLLLLNAWDDTTLIISGFFNGFYMLMSVTQGAITAQLVPRELLGNWYGIIGLFRGLVSIASPTLGGIIWETIGSEYIFYFLIATQLGKLLILVTIPFQETITGKR